MRGIKVLTACLLSIVAFCFAFAAPAAHAAAEDKTLEKVVFYMERGASARTVSGESGLRFTALMPKSDYDALRLNSDYSEIEYGMLICPADYIEKYGALNAENVFGENAVYTDGADDAKVKIMRFYSDEMTENEDGYMCFNGAIVDILPQNYLRQFVGVGYIAAKSASGTEYKFACPQDNERSVVYVAQRALQEEVLSESQREILGAYENAAAETPCSVRIVRHFEEVGGERVETETVSSAVGELVAAQIEEYAGYALNEKRSVSESVAYADDKTELHLYYNDLSITSAAAGRYAIDLSAAQNVLDTSALYGAVKKVNGATVTENEGKVVLSAESIAAMRLSAGQTEWKIETEFRTYTAQVYVYDKIISSFEELACLNENPYGHYLLGGDVYAVSPFSVTEFHGVLDGGGHCVYNAASASYKGFFESVSETGVIRNVVFRNLRAGSVGSAVYAALAFEFKGTAENVYVESPNARYLFYSPSAGASIEGVVGILPSGKSVVAKDNGAVLKNGFTYLGDGNGSGCAEENYFAVGVLSSFVQMAQGLPLNGISAGDNFVKAFDTFFVTL